MKGGMNELILLAIAGYAILVILFLAFLRGANLWDEDDKEEETDE